MSLKIYLLRHGETEYSQQGAYCGALDAELKAEEHLMTQVFTEADRSGSIARGISGLRVDQAKETAD